MKVEPEIIDYTIGCAGVVCYASGFDAAMRMGIALIVLAALGLLLRIGDK